MPLPMIATPIFGDQSHISIDRRFGFIGNAKLTSVSEADGRQLWHVSDTDNTAADVWSDSAIVTTNDSPRAVVCIGAKRAWARIEHVFAHQKNRFGLFIGTIGSKRAEAKLTLSSLAYNFDRLLFHQRRGVPRDRCVQKRIKTAKSPTIGPGNNRMLGNILAKGENLLS